MSARPTTIAKTPMNDSSRPPHRILNPLGEKLHWVKIDHPAMPYAQRAIWRLESSGRQRTRMHTKAVYRIVVRDELSPRYAEAFEGMEMESKYGQTVLTGEVKDQPHLHGILERINSLGLALVSVEDMSED